jgi:hypothetical protein
MQVDDVVYTTGLILIDMMSMYILLPSCRLIRPDKLVMAMQNFVMEQMGRKFIEPPPFDLDR